MAGKSSIEAGRGHVVLGADIAPLERGLAAGKQRFQDWGKAVAAVGASIAAAGAAVMAPFMLGISTFVEMGSAMQDMSDRTGLTVEALSELGHAARQSGAGAEDLEKSLREMGKTLVEASRGGPAANATLDALGVNLAELRNLSPEQQFERLAEGLSNITDPSLRATLATEVFGKAGAKLMPLLRSGSAGIQQLREEARRLGLSMSGEDAAAAEALGDQWANLVAISRKIAFELGAAIAPELKRVATHLIEAAAATSRFLRENRGLLQVIFGVGAGLVATGTAVAALGAAIYASSLAFTVMSAAIAAGAAVLSGIAVAAKFAAGGLGIMTVASYAFSIAYSGAMLATKAVTLATGAAMAAASTTAAVAIAAWGAAVTGWGILVSAAYATASLATSAYTSLVAIGYATAFAIAQGAVMAWAALNTIAWGMATAHAIINSAVMLAWAAAANASYFLAIGYALMYQGVMIGVGIVSKIAFGIATAAAIIHAAALAVVSGKITFATIASAAYAAVMVVVKAVTWLTTAAMAAYTGATVTAAAGTTVATGGLNLLAAALGLVVVALAAVTAGLILLPFVSAGIMLAKAVASLHEVSRIIPAIGAASVAMSDRIVGSVSRVTSAFSTAWTTTAREFSAMTSGLVETATYAFGAIKDAFKAGDWALIWELFKVAVKLAWIDIKGFVRPVWAEWKHSALTLFDELKNTLIGAFQHAFVAVKVAFVRMVEFMKGEWAVAKDIMANLGIAQASDAARHLYMRQQAAARGEAAARDIEHREAPAAVRADLARAEIARLQARLRDAATPQNELFAINNQLTQAVTRLRAAEAEVARQREPQIQAREAQRQQDLLQARIANAADRGERRQLEGELKGLVEGARPINWGDMENVELPQAPPPGGLADIGGSRATSLAGSFFADAFRGLAGVQIASPQERMAQRQDEANRILEQLAVRAERGERLTEDMLRELRRLQGLGFA